MSAIIITRTGSVVSGSEKRVPPIGPEILSAAQYAGQPLQHQDTPGGTNLLNWRPRFFDLAASFEARYLSASIWSVMFMLLDRTRIASCFGWALSVVANRVFEIVSQWSRLPCR